MNKKIHVKNNKNLAIKCVVLGVLSGIFGYFTAIPSIFLGHLFLYRYKQNPENYNLSERRMVYGGLLFGYIGFLLWSYVGWLLYKLFFMT